MARSPPPTSWTWIATDDNVNADHLSRGRVAEFFRTVYETGVWTEATVPEPMPDVGRTRTLPEGRGGLARSLAEEGLAAAAAAAAGGRNYESSSTNNSTSRQQPDSDEARMSATDFGAVRPGVTLTELLARAAADRPGAPAAP